LRPRFKLLFAALGLVCARCFLAFANRMGFGRRPKTSHPFERSSNTASEGVDFGGDVEVEKRVSRPVSFGATRGNLENRIECSLRET
jgi:hypothetical protein